MASSRISSHKMKSSITGNKEKRLLRVHRRSLDQREMRQEALNKRRQIDDDMSPVIESQEASKNPSAAATPVSQSQTAAASRLERLKKWKEERELKRKLEAMERGKGKPSFKVMHMDHKDIHLYRKDEPLKQTSKPVPVKAASAVQSKAAKPKAAAAPAAPTRASTTRSSTRANAKGDATSAAPSESAKPSTTTRKINDSGKKVEVPAPAGAKSTRSRGAAAARAVSPVQPKKARQKRSGRSNFMAPTAASRTKAVSNARKAHTDTAPATSAPATTTTVAKKHKKQGAAAAVPSATFVVKDSGKVTKQRGDEASSSLSPSSASSQPSFAPADFVFEAPSNLRTYCGNPLSPASAAGFLFPQIEDSTTASVFTKRVGRTSTPKRAAKLTFSSEEENVSDGGAKCSDDQATAQTQPSSGRDSRSKVRQSQSKSAADDDGGSPTLADQPRATESSAVVADSGIEVHAAGMDSNIVKTLAQNPSDDNATTAEEEGVLPDEKASKGTRRKSRKSVSKTESAKSVSKEENIAADQAEVGEESTTLSQSSAKKGKRKSKRVTIQDLSTESKEEGATPVKQRRKSRRSAIKVVSILEAEMEVEADPKAEASVSAQPLSENVAKEEKATPKKSRSSRRSVASKSHKAESIMEAEAEDATEPNTEFSVSAQPLADVGEEKATPKKLRPSRKSVASKSNEAHPEETMDEPKADELNSDRKCRKSRRSVAMKQAEDSFTRKENADSEEKPMDTKPEALSDDALVDMKLPEPSTPENRRSNLRSGRAKDDMFVTPGLPVSQKRSTTKRRRTATMIALSCAKSPEEAIKIIATSPMVEMNRRRTPKTKATPEVRNESAALTFDEKDFALAPLQLTAAFDTETASSSTDGCPSTSSAIKDGADASGVKDAQDNQPMPSTSEGQGVDNSDTDSGQKTRDVTPFREQLSVATDKLTKLADHWTLVREATTGLTEEVDSQICWVVGQARLLMDRKGKFHQFRGLVDQCEAGNTTTTCTDLQGFWDMVYIQAENISAKFDQLERLQQNNWQPDPSAEQTAAQPAKKTKKMPIVSKKPKAAIKSKFAAFRAEMQKQRKAQENNGSVSASASPAPPAEEKVFDAGFFKVNSPVRSPAYHCEAGTPKRRSALEQQPPSPVVPPSFKTQEKTTPGAATTTTTPAATASTGKADKENVAQVFLRRSVGATTPGRRSYLPAVPSPLVKVDAPPTPLSPSKGDNLAENSEEKDSGQKGGEKSSDVGTPVRPRRSLASRRSSRSRKSVSFVEKLQGEGDDGGEGDDEQQQEEEGRKGEGEGVDMMAYFEPSTSTQATTSSPFQEKAMEPEDSPFSVEDVLRPKKSDTPLSSGSPAAKQPSGDKAKNTRRSAASTERRRSKRTVSFAAPTATSEEGSFALPSTPYNKNALVAGRRVTRRSIAGSDAEGQSVLSELQELQATPPLRRSARPSLLYTPPKADLSKPQASPKHVPVATLIAFSPQGQ